MTYPFREEKGNGYTQSVTVYPDQTDEPLKVTLQLNVWPAVVTLAILIGALVGLLLWAWYG